MEEEFNFDTTMCNINKLINDIDIMQHDECKIDQQIFNTNFIIKFMVFMFYYRIYTMYIDPQCILINKLEQICFRDDIKDTCTDIYIDIQGVD